MKWKKTVSQVAKTTIATRLTTTKTTHATSTQASGDGQRRLSATIDAIALTAYGDDNVRTELRPKPPHTDVNHVGRRIESKAPHGLQEPLLSDGDPRMAHELLQQQELPFRQRDRSPSGVDLAAKHVQAKTPHHEVRRQV